VRGEKEREEEEHEEGSMRRGVCRGGTRNMRSEEHEE